MNKTTFLSLLTSVPLLIASGCTRTSIVARDTIVQPGKSCDLVASVHHQSMTIFCKGLQRESVQFFVKDQPVGQDDTDPTGQAQVGLSPVENEISFVARAHAGEHRIEAEGRVFVWDPQRTAIAIDLDETICASDYLNLIWGDGLGFPAIPGSAAAVSTLAEDYHIVYWSARPRYLIERTRRWLAKNGFPPGPIFFTKDNWGCFKQTKVKKKLLAELRQQWPNIRIGIGDKDLDVECCTQNDMLPVIVNPGLPKYEKYAVVVRDWNAVVELFKSYHEVLSSLPTLATAIENGDPIESAKVIQPIQGPPQRVASATVAK